MWVLKIDGWLETISWHARAWMEEVFKLKALAKARYLRIAPRKVRQVTQCIRGQKAEIALINLQNMNKKAARLVGKVLKSAIANAEQNEFMGAVDELVVSRACVDEGPTLRRFRPRAMGRAAKIRKRTSHITVVVDDGLD